MSTQDEDQVGELPSSRSGQQLNNLLALPETLRKRSSCMVDNLELGAPLGRGSYGKVYKGEPSLSFTPDSCRLFADYHRCAPSLCPQPAV